MTSLDLQLVSISLTAGLPTLTVLVGILINNNRLGEMERYMDTRFDAMQRDMDKRFDEVDRRFDQQRDLFHGDLIRVEQVLDARLQHLEERR